MNVTLENPSDIGNGRPAVRIRQKLRDEIVDGTYPPGSRLPIQTELAQRFGVTCVTIQRVIRQLSDAGFVQTARRGGTVVTLTPPYLCHYALIFPHSSEISLHSCFFATLLQVAMNIQSEGELRFFPFYGLEREERVSDYDLLLRRIDERRLAGLIFTSSPGWSLQNTPILDHPGVSRVAIMAAPDNPQLPAVWFNYKSFLDRALDYLQARGRRRIALLLFPRGYPNIEAYAVQGLAARGMTTEPCWMLHFNVNDADAAVDTTHLLMHKHGPDSPDGLIIMDDNLAEHAMRGLVAAGVQVPEQVDVVVHANYPCTGPAVLPVKRLGFDLDETLQLCVTDLMRQSRGEPVAPFTAMPARFEDEIQKNTERRTRGTVVN